MKIIFFGDSITDMHRNRESVGTIYGLGVGHPLFVAAALMRRNPQKYEIVNRGISGNRVVDLYARIKCDVWNLNPDVLSILVGVNDVWHELSHQNGVDIVRWESVYRMLIEDTLKRFPKIKIIINEPFVLPGTATDEHAEDFKQVYRYAAVAEKLAEEYKLFFLPLQEPLRKAAEKTAPQYILMDGVHPHAAGVAVIAEEWLRLFEAEIDK